MKDRHPLRSAAIFGVCLAVAFAMVLGAFWYRGRQAELDAEESRRADQSLCLIQNENRKLTRQNTSSLFALVTARLRYDPPRNPRTLETFEAQASFLREQLRALRPIDCETYVRPELPFPKPTVESP